MIDSDQQLVLLIVNHPSLLVFLLVFLLVIADVIAGDCRCDSPENHPAFAGSPPGVPTLSRPGGAFISSSK